MNEEKNIPTVQNYLEKYRRGIRDGYAENIPAPRDFLPETHSGEDSYNVRHSYTPGLYEDTFPAMEAIGVPPVHNSQIIDEIKNLLVGFCQLKVKALQALQVLHVRFLHDKLSAINNNICQKS
ncbi:MAG: hypothetical protein FWE27_07350 [Defluviitaleaceae bacterium]|nr:hypothetical protein [Defluviitaleaceae bacterium]